MLLFRLPVVTGVLRFRSGCISNETAERIRLKFYKGTDVCPGYSVSRSHFGGECRRSPARGAENVGLPCGKYDH